MGFGQSQYDITTPQQVITLNQNLPVRLPPNGNEFGTNLAPFSAQFDDNGGKTATLRYTGQQPALVQLTATMSFERVPGSSSQHVFIGWAVGAPPLSVANVSPNTRQETDLAFDSQDTILHVDGAFTMNPGDEAQVWVRQVPFVTGEDMLFKVTGFMMTAQVVEQQATPGRPRSHANLVLGEGESQAIALPEGTAVRLPPVAQFMTQLRSALNFDSPGPGSLRYIGGGAPITCKLSGTITVERVQGLDSTLTLFLNVGSPPNNGTKDTPSAQAFRVDSSNESDILHVQALLSMAPASEAQIWLSREPGGAPFSCKVVGYSLTITEV